MESTAFGDISEPWKNRAWIQDILRELKSNASLSITEYHIKDSSSKGDHYLSEMYRIYVRIQEAVNVESEMFLIVKKLPLGKELIKILSQSSPFKNEIKIFKEILPKFHAILENAAPGRFPQFAARHIYSQNKLPYFLVLSDLMPEGFKMAKRKEGLDLDHCLLVMKTLGRYHAASVALHERDYDLIESMKENIFTEESSKHLMENFCKQGVISLTKVVRSWPGGEEMAKKLHEKADTILEQYKQQLSPQGNRLNVLIHGDLWINNMLFKYNNVTGKVEDMRMVDFQLGRYASCAIDLQYFIHTSPTEEVRISHTEDLLKEYHSELCSTLNLLGVTHATISFQELLEEYERKGVYGFFTSMVGLPIIFAEAEDAADIEGYVNGKDQSSDLRATNKEYVKVMKRLLPLFQQKGYF